MIISKTPYRISLFGGGTDFPNYFKKYNGSVIGGSINKYCYITARVLPKFFSHELRFVWSIIENVKNADQIRHPSLKAILKFLKIKSGYEIHYDGDLPGMSGTGSSSAFTIGTLNCLSNIIKNKLTKKQMYKNALCIEQKIMKESIGNQDQYWATYGGFKYLEFKKNDSIYELNLINNKNIKRIEKNLIIFYTGKKRISANIEKEKIKNIDKNIKYFHEIKSHVNLCKNIILNNMDINEIGFMLNDAWELKKKLSPLVTDKYINEIYKIGIDCGALGGKLLGAGGGGFILFYANEKNQQKIKKKLYKLQSTNIKFTEKGSEIIYNQ